MQLFASFSTGQVCAEPDVPPLNALFRLVGSKRAGSARAVAPAPRPARADPAGGERPCRIFAGWPAARS